MFLRPRVIVGSLNIQLAEVNTSRKLPPIVNVSEFLPVRKVQFFRLSGADEETEKTFRLNTSTGQIFLERSLDFDDPRQRRIFSMTISNGLSDSNQQDSLLQLVITLVDANSNVPRVALPDGIIRFSVNDSTPVGHLLGYIGAIDDDDSASRNSELNFQLAF